MERKESLRSDETTQFTVTRVDEEKESITSKCSSRRSSGIASASFEFKANDSPKHVNNYSPIQSSSNGPIPLETISPKATEVDIEYGTSDIDSNCGDTLTQTSVTKLLATKLKTYRTWRCDSRRAKTITHLSSQTSERTKLKKRLVDKYESQDYELVENYLFFQEQQSQKYAIKKKWVSRWLIHLLIGIGTALVAVFIKISIEYLAYYKFEAIKYLVERCVKISCAIIPLVTWMAINATLVFIGSMLVTYVEPLAAGSGIPQVKCYLNGIKLPGLLTVKALIVKSVGVILSVSGGLACGKEGPMIHSGAVVAAGISQGKSKYFKKDFKIFESLRAEHERRDFVSGGAAAGVSAAFGAPVGGVLFSLEEGASFWNQSLTWRTLFASMVATFTVNLIISAKQGKPSDLSYPGLISFGHFTNITYQAIEVPIFLVMAVIGGLLGALFNYMNMKLTLVRNRYMVEKWRKVLEAVIVSMISALFAFLLIYFTNECAPNSDLASSHNSHHGHENNHSIIKIHCPDGTHNVMSLLLFKTPEESLISMLHDPGGKYPAKILGCCCALYYLLGCWTYGLSVSSGIFIPSLLTGATWGRLVGVALMYFFPEIGNHIGKYALIGAASQLGGNVRMTISLCVILIECTGDITLGLPIVMVLIIAKWVGDFFNSGIYDLHIGMMGIPLLPWEPPEVSHHLIADEIMNSKVVVLRTIETYNRIVKILEDISHAHNGFPVVEDTAEKQVGVGDSPRDLNSIDEEKEQPTTFGTLKGLILRKQIHDILTEIDSDGKSKPTDDMKIDLTPHMNPSPYRVNKECSLPRVFRLFRGLGIRHLVVVDDSNQVIGVITRKDLAKYRLKSIGSVMEVHEMEIHPK